MKERQFERIAWTVLIYAIAVIVWGAVVRATSSGAGCGAHWPLCNGEVVPIAPQLATIIEFAHRSTSGILLGLTLLLLWMAFQVFPAGHAVRRAATWTLIFVILEALIGAGIVLLQLVKDNASVLRAVYIAGHLTNTLMLVGAYTATIVFARERQLSWTHAQSRALARHLQFALAGLIVVAAVGAVVALGDTLFPAQSLAQGFAADRDPASHFLIRLRVWHPAIATLLSFYLVTVVARADALDEPALRTPARVLIAFVVLQVTLGAANLLTLAPLALQMAHLLVSNLLWVAVAWMFFLSRQHAAADPRA